jgi:hypothetical protein
MTLSADPSAVTVAAGPQTGIGAPECLQLVEALQARKHDADVLEQATLAT